MSIIATGVISYHSVLYSVDPEAVGRTVMVRPEGDDVGADFSVYLAIPRWHVTIAGRKAIWR